MDSRKISEILKAKREALRLSIPHIVEQTKIKSSYLEAMEKGDFSIFENPVYIRNFVRSYARFLKIPESQILPLLMEGVVDAGAKAAPAASGATEPSNPPGERLRNTSDLSEAKAVFSKLFVATAAVVILGGFFLMFRGARHGSRDAVRPSPAPADEEAVSARTASDTSSWAADTAVPGSEHRAEMRALAEVWLFWETEEDQFKKLLQPGEKASAVFEKNFHLRVGNPSGLALRLDGTDIVVDTGKVYDRVFRVEEDGRVAIEPTSPQVLRRFQSRAIPGDDP